MKTLLLIFFAFILIACNSFAQEAKPPVRFAIVGLNHDHAMGFIPRLAGRSDVQLVGIVETKKSGIQLIVNYETTWYPGNQAAFTMVHDEHQIGDIRRIVVHDGHRGPKEIGCSTEFLAWLTDPILNGGGAINDFGCYGADLATWLLDGEKPLSVFAVARHINPDLYPKVEDDATIVLTYPKAEVILQPSWNWAIDRKDMEIYGQTGYVFVPQANLLRVRTTRVSNETEITPQPITGVNADPISYFAAVVRKEVKPAGLSSLETNMIVVEILDAAHKSVRTGKQIKL
jgi:predicted dehydrogenase